MNFLVFLLPWFLNSYQFTICFSLTFFAFNEYIHVSFIQAICKTVKEIANPIIAENIEKYKIESVEFESLTLGSLPPTFPG